MPSKSKKKKNVYASDNTTRTTGDIPDGTQAVFLKDTNTAVC